MDEISLLSRSRTDIPERSSEEVARGRAALFAAVEREVLPAAPLTPRRRRTTWAGWSAVGAAGLTTALVVVNVLGSAGDSGGDAAAAAVLVSAAEATLEFSDPVVAPGQYLRVLTEGVGAAIGDLGGGDTAVLLRSRTELFIPADRSADWIWISCNDVPIQTFGADSEALAALIVTDFASIEPGIFRSFPAGRTPGGGAFGGFVAEDGMGRTDAYGTLQRDPSELLATIYEINGTSGQSRDGQALGWIADTLRLGTVPADLRAALYEAAALIPGVTITEQEATLNGRAGIAVGRVEDVSNTRQDIIIDADTGQFIGEREVALVDYADLPAGTATWSTAVTTTVVDSVPTDAATCTAP